MILRDMRIKLLFFVLNIIRIYYHEIFNVIRKKYDIRIKSE